MARQMSPEKEREYAELNAFLDIYATHVMKIDPKSPAHPTNAGERIVAAVGKAKALVGLRQAINDTLEGLQDLSAEQLRPLDIALKQAGIVTITELRRRYSRQFKAILKRGSIRNETEYYMIKATLDDCAGSVAQAEREQLGSMLLAYEQAANNSFKPNPLRGSA
jgi:hypothetical protein